MQLPQASFRRLFSEAARRCHLQEWEFKPYSLRRGGATEDFRSHGQLDRTTVRGRWASSRTARIYINESVAVLADLNLQPKSQERICELGRKFNSRIFRDGSAR